MGQNSTAVGNRRPRRASTDTQVAKVGTSPRTQVRTAPGAMLGSRSTKSGPDGQTAWARMCEEDDVFDIGSGASSKLDAKASKEEISIQRVLKGKHREHSTAIKQPHRRIRPCDNLNDTFEEIRAQNRPLSTRPEPPKTHSPLNMTKPVSAWEHYMEFVISSTRARQALVSFREQVSAEPSDEDDEEVGRFKDDELCRLVIQRSIERLIAEAENLERSCLGREVNALERKARAGLY